MLHTTTFEVAGKLCLIACAYSEKSYDQLSLPFLCLHLNHSSTQDENVMDYQKKLRAGLINESDIARTQRKLQCVLASLENVRIVNPFAPLNHPARRSATPPQDLAPAAKLHRYYHLLFSIPAQGSN